MQLDKEAAAKADAERRYNEAMASSGATDSDLFPPNAKPGECWARTFVAPTYRTVTETVLEKGESERVKLAPARYEFVEERVLVKEASSRMEIIPAEYKTVKVRRMVTPPSENRITIPAEYGQVTRTEQITEGHMEWRRILCETNTTPGIISRVQQALLTAGHNPGPIDGVIGSQTNAAIKSFQRKHGLATGGLTYKTIEKLGVSL